MPVEIIVPQLGESVVDATLARWLKQPGDTVEPGEPIVALETDKVDLDVSVEQRGVLSQVNRAEGDTVVVGEVLGLISADGEAAAATPPQGAEAAQGATAEGSTGTAVPTLDQTPAAGPPAESEALATPPTPQTAVPGPPTSEPSAAPVAGQDAPAAEREDVSQGDALATPLARSIADKNDLDLSRVPGTGPRGKVTKDDVANFIERMAAAPAAQAEITEQAAALPEAVAPVPPAEPYEPRHTQTPIPVEQPAAVYRPPAPIPETTAALSRPPAPAPAPVMGGQSPVAGPVAERPEERRRLSRRRQTIAARLVEAQQTAAMLTTFNEVDMTAIMEIRKRRKDSFKEKHGVGLGFMSFFARAVVGALKAFPMVNAEIQGDEVVIKRYYDLGIAVSTEEGLVVPVVRNVDRLTFAEIEKAIADLATRAREGKLTLPELYGGTFTVTNGGVFGSLLSTPILNAPQVGILGMHKIQERPVVVNGEIAIRPMMYLALSYDHRLIDGSEAVRFLVKVKDLLEDPETLLLEG